VNLKGLEAFTRIMATGTLSAAAEDMNVSVSALSRQLALLEEELGLILFSRVKRRLIPTEEGESLFREAERMLDHLRHFPEIVNEIKKGARRQMRIIVTPRIASSIAAPAVSAFLNEFTEVGMTIDVQPPGFVERWVVSREFDLGIGALPARHSDLQTEKICSVPAVAIFPPSHMFASRLSVPVSELSRERLITMPLDTLLGQQVAEILDAAKVIPKSPIHVSQASVCCNLVAQGLGVAITDPMTPQVFGKEIKMRPIEPSVNLDFGLLFLRGAEHTKETTRFAEIVRAQAKSFVENLDFD